MSRERVRAARRWLLLDGNRYVIAGALLALVFAVVAGLGRAGVLALGDAGAVRGIGGSLIPALFTFVSIVLAINQLVLSEEFGSAEEIRARVEEVAAFRRDVESLAGASPSPILPTQFLELVVEAVGAHAAALEEASDECSDPAAAAAVASYAEAVAADAAAARESLDRVEPGRVNAVLSVLAFDESEHRYGARRIQTAHGDALSPTVADELADLADALELFSVARSHFRMTYTQRLLARLSRLILYLGVPAVLAAVVLGTLGTPTAGGLLARYRVLVVSALLTVAMSPLAILFGYILRVAAVSERTVGVSPFVSRPGAADELATGRAETDEKSPGGRADPRPDRE